MLDQQTQPVMTGSAVLSDAESYLRRFVILPSDHAYVAATLWAGATYCHGAFSALGRLAFLSSEPASGKTRAQDVLSQLCCRPRMELDPTGPVISALISQDHPTLFLDEVDTIFGARGSASAHRQLRGILNSGYKAGAVVTRLSKSELISTPVYGPVCFAGLGNLPDTLMTRSIVIRMRQRKAGEICETYSPRAHSPLGQMTGAALGSWIASVVTDLSVAWPDMPEGVTDRAEECWSPLLAIADQAGGDWPERARAAAVALTSGQPADDVQSPADQLLSDLAMVWPRNGSEPVRNAGSAELLAALRDLPASPWGSLWAPESAAREMSGLLSSRGVSPRKIRPAAGSPCQGYRWADVAGTGEADDS
jgi:Protein of unknown function (DUF3631)